MTSDDEMRDDYSDLIRTGYRGMFTKDISELRKEVLRLHLALVAVGRLTRWVGGLESDVDLYKRGVCHKPPNVMVAEDLREIKRIAEQATGLSFEEYT